MCLSGRSDVVNEVKMGDEPSARAIPAPGSHVEAPAPGAPWWRRELRFYLEILAAAAFAIAQPLLASFGDSPETFIMSGASRLTVVAFAVLLVVVPPLVVWVVVAAVGSIWPRMRIPAQALAIGFLVALLVKWVLQGVITGKIDAVLAVVVGGLVALAYPRFAALRLYLSFAAAAPVAFLAMFIGFSATTPLVLTPGAATASAAGAEPASVVVVILDELPTASLLDDDDRIDAGLYPNVARLAGDSTFYRNNTTVATHTDAAVPPILSGRYPKTDKPARVDYSQNLFTLLNNSHALNVHEAITALCTAKQCDRAVAKGAINLLAQRAWVLWTDLVRGNDGQGPVEGPALQEVAPRRFEQPQEFIDSLATAGDRPQLDFGHLLIPHQQWETVPSGAHYRSGVPYLSQLNGTFTSDSGAQLSKQRHLLQVQYTDRVLGRILDRLEELGRYDRSLVIVLSDHGAAFVKDEATRGGVLTEKTVPEVLWAPLFVKEPGQDTGGVSDENTQSIDLVPTIADAVGIDIPWQVDGRSLLRGQPLAPGDKRYLPSPAPADEARYEGKIQRVDGEEAFERMLALPPASAVDSADPLALYRRPPFLELAGTPVEALTVGPPADLEVRLVDPEAYEDVDLGDRYLPLFVRGVVTGPGALEARVVVAVNGVVAGWSSYEIDWGDPERPEKFGVAVPPSLLRSGRNAVELFTLSGEPGAVTLHPAGRDDQ